MNCRKMLKQDGGRLQSLKQTLNELKMEYFNAYVEVTCVPDLGGVCDSHKRQTSAAANPGDSRDETASEIPDMTSYFSGSNGDGLDVKASDSF